MYMPSEGGIGTLYMPTGVGAYSSSFTDFLIISSVKMPSERGIFTVNVPSPGGVFTKKNCVNLFPVYSTFCELL